MGSSFDASFRDHQDYNGSHASRTARGTQCAICNSRIPLSEDKVHSPGRGHVLGTLITQLKHVHAVQQMFPCAEKDRADRNLHFVNESGLEVLPNRTDATTDPNVLAVRCVPC